MTRTTISLTNDFHNSSVTLRPASDGTLTARQVRRAKRALCVPDCTCSGASGVRGAQDDRIDLLWSVRTGRLVGARLCSYDPTRR